MSGSNQEDENPSHPRNEPNNPNQLLLDVLTARMAAVMDERLVNFRADMRHSITERKRRNRNHSATEQHNSPSSRSHGSRKRVDEQRSVEKTKHLQEELRKQRLYEEVKTQVLEAFNSVKVHQKKSPAVLNSIYTETTKKKLSCSKELSIQSDEEQQRQSSSDSREQQTKLVKHLPLLRKSLEAKCDLFSTQSDIVLEKLTHLEPVKPSSNVSDQQVLQEESPAEKQLIESLISNLEQPIQFVSEPAHILPILGGESQEESSAKTESSLCKVDSEVAYEVQSSEREKRPETYLSLAYPAFKPRELPDLASRRVIITTESTQHLLLGAQISETHDLIHCWQTFLTGHSFKHYVLNFPNSSIMHLSCPISVEKDAGSLEKHKCLEAGKTLNILAIKEKPPDLQQSQFIQPKPKAMSETEDVTRENALEIQNQEGELMCYIQLKEKPPDICQQKTDHAGVWNWEYLGKTTSITKGCPKLKLCFDIHSITICFIFLVVPKLFPFDVGDLAFLQLKSTSQRHEIIKASSVTLKDEPPDAVHKSWLSQNRTRNKGDQKENVANPEYLLPYFVLPLYKAISRKDVLVISKALIQEETPDPLPLALMIASFEPIQVMNQVSNFVTLFVSHVLGTLIMISLLLENIEKKLDLFNKYFGLNSCLRKEEHEMISVMIKAEICSYVYNDPMTVLMHLLFAKGYVIAGVKEEPPDLEDSFSKSFVKTGTGVVMMQDKEINTYFRMILEINGCGAGLKRPRRTVKREEDKRFKPPDLDQDIHPWINSFIMIKEAPPDATYNPKLNPSRSQGKCNMSSSFNTDLVSFCADKSDLRTNPFQVGEDDMILASKENNKTNEHKEQLELELNGVKHGPLEQLVAEEAKEEGDKDQHVSLSPMNRSNQERFKQAFTNTHTLSRAILSVLIQPHWL